MKIERENGMAWARFDIAEKKVSDEFKTTGKIGAIGFRVKSNEWFQPMKIKIAGTVLANEELNNIYEMPGEINIGPPRLMEVTGKGFIEFKPGDVFEFEQPSDNVSEITLWFTELDSTWEDTQKNARN